MRRKYLLALIIPVILMGCCLQNADQKNDAEKKAFGENGYECKVTKVIDGDTLVCEGPDGGHNVRLIGIDAAEEGMPFSEEARNELLTLAPVGASITLNFEDSKFDKYQRVLAYIFNSSKDVNLQLIKSGFAKVNGEFQFARYEEFEAAELEARWAGHGMWMDMVCITASGTGKKYHHCDCHHLKRSKKLHRLTRPDAELIGYTPCGGYKKKRAK